MMTPFKSVLLGSCAAAALTAPPALAQQTNAMATLEEIVVTAQFRESSVQDTPIAMSVISGDDLMIRNATGTDEILRDVPGVDVRRAPVGSFITIRGISSVQGGGEIDPGISFSVDGVYNPFSETSFLSFVDVDRIEVLKGPQGTLYGRNAIAGTVNVITKSPQLDELGGFVQLNGGNYATRGATGMLNIPVSETVAARFVGDYRYNNGYLSNGSDDTDVLSGRGKVLWEPNSDFKLEFRGDYAEFSGQGNAPAIFPYRDDPWTAYDTPETPYQDIWVWGLSAQADLNLGFATLTYIPAYKKKRNDTATDGGGFFIHSFVYDTQHTEEVRLTSNSASPLSWIVGAYYFRGVNDTGLSFGAVIAQHVITTSYAGFGQATYALSDRLRLTGGLRFTRDNKVEDGTNTFNGTVISEIDNIHFTWKNWTWRAGLEYDLRPDSMLYANVSTGFKAGGTSLVAGPNAFFDPEKLTAYELGIKNRFLDDHLTLNVSAYNYDYENYQATFVAPNPDFGNVPTRRVANAGNAKIHGGEIQAQFTPTRNDVFSATLAYIHGKFDRYVVPTMVPGIFNDYSGSKISVPPWSATSSYSHSFLFGNGGRLTPQISGRYNSGVYRDARQYTDAGAWGTASTYVQPVSYQDSFVKVDASLTYSAPDDRYRVTVYVKNLTDKVVATGISGTPGSYAAYLEPPRTYGVTLNFNW